MRVPFEVDNKGFCISGMLHIPDSTVFTGKIVIVCYGFNGNRVEEHRMMVKLGEDMGKNGIILGRLDYHGQGLSSGHMYDVSFENRVEDILATINYVKGCFNGDSNLKFYIIGFSDGARIATQVCHKEDICGIILWNPIFSMSGSPYMSKQSTKDDGSGAIINTLTKRLNYQLYGVPVNPNYLAGITKGSEYDSYLAIKPPCEKICIWGGNDRYTQEARKKIIAQTDIQNYVVDGAEHLFNGREYETEVLQITLKYLLEVISG